MNNAMHHYLYCENMYDMFLGMSLCLVPQKSGQVSNTHTWTYVTNHSDYTNR